MSDDINTLQLENKLLRLAGQCESVLASAYGNRTVLVTGGKEDAPIAVEVLDVSPATARRAIGDLKVPTINFYDLPRLTVTVISPDIDDTKVDAAAPIMAAWNRGHGHLFDEMCVHAWEDWLGYPGAAMAAPLVRKLSGMPDAESSDDFADVEVHVSRRSFAEWIRQLRSSNDEDVAHFGNGLHRSYRHFRNHDLEGNRYNRAGEIVSDDDLAYA